MHRSFWWSTIVILAILITPLAGLIGVPAKPVRAEPLAPSAVQDDEVILLTSAGQIRVDDPFTPSGYKPATWNSEASTGWTMVAAGDFNGDGDAEIVATKSNVIKAFDPIIQPGRQQVVFDRTLGSGQTIQLLVTGDFDGDGKDEIAIVYYVGGSLPYALQVYDGGTNAIAGEWTVSYQSSYNAAWKDMSAGDVNGDNADDLVMVRNVDRQIIVYNGRNWGTLAQQSKYATDWYAVAAGNMWAAYTGAEIALVRYGANAQVNALLLMRVVGGALSDLGGSYKYEPEFTSLATGDVNGDGDDEVLMLRNPVISKTSLQMVNPAGTAIRGFQESTGYTWPYFTLVRMGDVDGDGRDEVIIERTDRYRIYYQPETDNSYTDYAGTFHTAYYTVNNIPTMAVANIDGSGLQLGPVLSVSPSTLDFTLEYRESSPTKTINITNVGTSDVISWQAQVEGSAPWLRLASTSGTTPGTLGVSVDSSQLAPRPTPYTAKIKITATAPANTQSSPQEVTVNVTITGVTMLVNPQVLSFEIGYGDTVAAKQVKVASQSGSAPFGWHALVQGGSTWLTVSPAQGTSPTTVNVSVNSRVNLPGGPYIGSIMFVADDPNIANPLQYVTVKLTVNDAGLVVTPDTVSIWQEIGAPRVERQVSIERPGIRTDWNAAAVPVEGLAALQEALAAGRFEVTGEGLRIEGMDALPPVDDWLSFTPNTGTTSTTMTLTAKDYTPGIYHAIIVVIAADPDVPNRTRQINVTVNLADNIYTSFLPMVAK